MARKKSAAFRKRPKARANLGEAYDATGAANPPMKFARLITMKVRKGLRSKFTKTFASEVASTSIGLKGLRRLYLFKPIAKGGEFVVLSLWDSETDAKAYAKSSRYRAYNAKLAPFLKREAQVRELKIKLHKVGVSVRRS
ncbi:MAG: antibiotic biosynthesis monooxygenase [Thaumarchaeota archaeon]|nr:antibiotic biosynthesis monooxygenase [Nitrososphaerota archaeon]